MPVDMYIVCRRIRVGRLVVDDLITSEPTMEAVIQLVKESGTAELTSIYEVGGVFEGFTVFERRQVGGEFATMSTYTLNSDGSIRSKHNQKKR
jgi:hypothetical protein